MQTKYSVALMYADGSITYLTVRDKTEWTKRTARKHRDDMLAVIDKGGFTNNVVDCFLESQFGEIVD